MNRFNGSAPTGEYVVDVWQERGRASVVVSRADTGATVAEWWDEDVYGLVEDGFLDPHDWERSAIDYCVQLGIIAS